MKSPEDNAARLTLKLAGVFQDVRNTWAKRLENYFTQIESLINGQWIEPSDMVGIIREACVASQEALDGLSTDLSAELVHESRGIFGRFESERQALLEEINDLRSSLAVVTSGDEGMIRRENDRLRKTLLAIPEFKLLETLRSLGRGSYNELAKASGFKTADVRKHTKSLMQKGFVAVDRKSRPHKVIFLSAPWRSIHHSLEKASSSTSSSRLHQAVM